MTDQLHPMTPHHLPFYLAKPGETDVLMVVMGIFLILAVLGVGNIYLRLHSLPERMAHKSQKLQFEIVAVLGLISLFTHIHLFWIAGLLLALIDLPDFSTPLRSIAGSVEKIADDPRPRRRCRRADQEAAPAQAERYRLRQPLQSKSSARRRRSAAMFELMLCSLFTILPDYLYRRYVQGKRFGKEITLFSVWYELRWGITGCLMLTFSLITMIFYFHPSTTSAALFFRTVPIVPEGSGRVAEVNVDFSAPVKKGDVTVQARQLEAAGGARNGQAQDRRGRCRSSSRRRSTWSRRKPRSRRPTATIKQAKDELDVKSELQRRNPGIVPQRDIEKLQVLVDQRQAALDAATAAKQSAETQVSTLLPAEKASAEAALAQAQVDLDKTFVRAGVDGRVEQFVLRPGDVVNPLMRPAGILIPEGAGQRALQAGFGQIEAQVMKPGMVAEATCISKPWTIIPMVVTSVQDYIAAGQFRGGEQLIDAQNVREPGTILVFLEPLYKGGLDGVTAGSSCIVNAYTSNHEEIARKTPARCKGFALHADRRRRTGACVAVADPGAAAADQDAGAERPLTGDRNLERMSLMVSN